MLLSHKFCVQFRRLHRHFVGLALLALTGCGFTPLYGGAPGQNAGAALETVQVQTIPNREGQLLHQALQQDFYRNGEPIQALYTLSVSYSINQTGEGVQADSSTTRIRFTAEAKWRLSPIGQPATTLVSGNAIAMDALNVIDQQYFAANLETETVDQQLANEISAQITTRLAAWFRVHPGS